MSVVLFSEKNKLGGLQIARAVAALSIAYFHSWVALDRFPKGSAYSLPVLTEYGWLAVDLFFAISGFVICIVVSRPSFNVASFLIKRAFRLYPLWLVTLTAFAVMALVWRGPIETETIGYFLYSATLLPTEHFPFYDVGWSLQHEMVFYLIAAIFVPFSGFYGLAGFLALSTLSYHLIELPWYLSNLAEYHGEFLAGVLAFMARPRLARYGFWIPFAIGSAALWYFVTQWGGRAYLPLPLFFLVLAFSNVRQDGSRFETAAAAVGDASYSIYLIHPLVFVVAKSATTLAPPIWSQEPIRVVCFFAIIGLSLLSWRHFERPMIAIGSKMAKRKHFPAAPNATAVASRKA